MDTGKREENVLFNDTDSKCYMESRVWLRTIQITREETRCRYFVGYLVSSKVCYMDHPRQDSITHTHTHTQRGMQGRPYIWANMVCNPGAPRLEWPPSYIYIYIYIYI